MRKDTGSLYFVLHLFCNNINQNQKNMKKTFNYGIILGVIAIAILTSTILISCNKNANKQDDINANLDVVSYSVQLMNDTSFANFMQSYTLNLYKLKSVAFDDNGIKSNLNKNDSLLAIGYNNNILSAITIFMNSNRSFFLLSPDNMSKVTNYISSSLNSSEYIKNNPFVVAKLLSVDNIVRNELKSSNASLIQVQSYGLIKNAPTRVSSNLIIGCAIGTLVGAALAYESAINEIIGLFGKGWSVSGIMSIALDILQNAGPWWKAGAIAIGFGACVYAGA